MNWISHQLFRDYVRTVVHSDVVWLRFYAHKDTNMVNLQFLLNLDNRINTSLYDQWLSDIDFFLDYKEFKEQRDIIKDSITQDLIKFWETQHSTNGDRISRQFSKIEKLAHDEMQHQLLVKHEEIRTAIKAKAVSIDL